MKSSAIKARAFNKKKKKTRISTHNDSVAMILSDKPNMVSTRVRSTRGDR